MRASQTDRTRFSGPRAGSIAFAAFLVAALVPAAAAQACSEPGRNVQCSELGSIRMDSVREIRGAPIQLAAEVTLNSAFKEQGARWFLFSVRNVTGDGINPVQLQVDSFTADGAPIVTSKDERKAHETNFWVDVEDVPVGKTIRIEMTVGSAEAGAFQLEALVMAFDRGYAAMHDSTGAEASLFSFTLLGVKSPTGAVGASPLSRGYTVPGLEAPAAALAVLASALLLRRRLA